MLVLTRRAGESIMIGSEISVRVVEVRGDVVRIGVDAPRTVQVHREEVFEAVRAQNLAAAGTTPGSLDALRAGLAGRFAGASSRLAPEPSEPSAPSARPGPSGPPVQATTEPTRPPAVATGPSADLAGTRPKPGPPQRRP